MSEFIADLHELPPRTSGGLRILPNRFVESLNLAFCKKIASCLPFAYLPVADASRIVNCLFEFRYRLRSNPGVAGTAAGHVLFYIGRPVKKVLPYSPGCIFAATKTLPTSYERGIKRHTSGVAAFDSAGYTPGAFFKRGSING
ncbi:MAG: hypothetical protein GY765_16265 [bacterium]|nr:hypothetical protein [bacterium]